MDAMLHYFFSDPDDWDDDKYCMRYSSLMFMIENNLIEHTIKFD